MLASMLRPPPLLRAAAVAATAVTLLLTGCDGDAPTPAPPPEPSSTPLADFATDALAVARQDFCSRVAPAAVEAALGGAAHTSADYGNGDRAEVAPGVRDVAHEYGCRWSTRAGTTARGWVFAPPVTPGQADVLRRAADDERGCVRVADAPRYGARTVAVRCEAGDGVTVAFHGLFGDAWLSCSLAVPGRSAPGDLLDRAGRWCVTVAQAAA
jgi:hypothetical protein